MWSSTLVQHSQELDAGTEKGCRDFAIQLKLMAGPLIVNLTCKGRLHGVLLPYSSDMQLLLLYSAS